MLQLLLLSLNSSLSDCGLHQGMSVRYAQAWMMFLYCRHLFSASVSVLLQLVSHNGLVSTRSILMILVEVKIAGVGQHEDVLLATNPTAVVHWAKAGYAIEELYCTAVIFPKLSILGFYLRIFTTKLFRITVYIIAGILIVNGIAGVITSLSTCQPFAARWDPSIPGAHCINTPQYWRWISFANIATDVVMLCLPLPAVWRLHVSTAQKYGLTLVFLTGSM